MMKHTVLVLLFLTTAVVAKDEFDQNFQFDNELSQLKRIKNGIDFFTVGADVACNYSSIQSAIDDFSQSPFGNIEIRIASNKTYFENIIIEDETLSLIGGYANCTQALQSGNPGNNQSIIDGNNLESVIRIEGTTQRRTVNIKNLRLLHGTNVGPGGGLVSYVSDVALLLENVDIRNNTAHYGAGIAIIAGNTDLLMNESRVLGNTAEYGGGIYCSGGASSVNVANHSGIIANFATSSSTAEPFGRGAGAYVDGCYFAIFTGSSNNGTLTGMDVNNSTSGGGAIYAKNALIRMHGHQHCGSVGCLGDDTNPVSFRSNQAGGEGAVLYAQNSDVKINATWINGNVGDSVLYLEDSELVIERNKEACWSSNKCNLIENNIGTVLAGFANGDIEISSTNILNNSTMVFDINSSPLLTNPLFRVESSMINNNASNNDDYLFKFYGLMNTQFIHNTIVDNPVVGTVFRTDYNSNVTGPITFEIHSSIVYNSTSTLYSFNEFGFIGDMHITVSACFSNSFNISGNNLIINDADDYSGGAKNTLMNLSTTYFIDKDNEDYRLSESSPAIDYINTTQRIDVNHFDIDFEERGFDDINNPSPGNALLLYDVGADESYLSDIIFKNSFE